MLRADEGRLDDPQVDPTAQQLGSPIADLVFEALYSSFDSRLLTQYVCLLSNDHLQSRLIQTGTNY